MKNHSPFSASIQSFLFLFLTFLISNCSPSEEKETEKNSITEKSKENDTEQKGSLYIKSFGDSKNIPVIFLHGGPGYNSANFEASTAQTLADNGYFVIVYDRRGEGRSTDVNAKFDFPQTFEDLNSVYEKFDLDSAILIGHSYGGVVATLFAEKNPEKIKAVVLVGAPVSLQESFKTIIKTCKKIYANKKDNDNLKYIAMLETMDSTSLDYSSYCFAHAMQNGFYSPKKPSDEAKGLYEKFKTDPIIQNHAMKMTVEGPKGFWENEKYTTINLAENIIKMVSNGMKIYGLYGKDDGLYSNEQVMALKQLLGEDHLIYFDNCSHNVFIDQQSGFIIAINSWIK